MKRQVLERAQCPKDNLQVVMCHLPEAEYQPYVTWIYNKDFNGYAYGNYFGNALDAWKDFCRRVKEYEAKWERGEINGEY